MSWGEDERGDPPKKHRCIICEAYTNYGDYYEKDGEELKRKKSDSLFWRPKRGKYMCYWCHDKTPVGKRQIVIEEREDEYNKLKQEFETAEKELKEKKRRKRRYEELKKEFDGKKGSDN